MAHGVEGLQERNIHAETYTFFYISLLNTQSKQYIMVSTTKCVMNMKL